MADFEKLLTFSNETYLYSSLIFFIFQSIPKYEVRIFFSLSIILGDNKIN